MSYDHLKNYVAANYSYLAAHLTDAQYEQIAWIDDAHKTNEMATAASPANPDKIELKLSVQQKRIFARLNCLYLLRQGEAGYHAFIEAQSEPKLELSAFIQLSTLIRALTPDEYEMLWVATTISMSTTAVQKAESTLGRKLSFDAVNFLAEVMTKCPRIYPAAAALFKQHPKAIAEIGDGFGAMFDTGQLRHMLYTEGAANMFAKLKYKIKIGHWSERLYNLWFAYWLIDIAGFRGHLDSRGSCYLNQNTFRALMSLKEVLDKFQTTPNPMLTLREYLCARAEMIGLTVTRDEGRFLTVEIPEAPRLILAHLAAMLRLFTPKDGTELQNGLGSLAKKLTPTVYDSLIAVCSPLRDSDEPTPTFAPALFANLTQTVGTGKAIEYGLPAYATAVQQYRELRAHGELPKDLPLNLNALATAENIKKILAGEFSTIKINPDTGQAELVAPRDEHTFAPK